MWKQAPTAYPWLVELGSTALENTTLSLALPWPANQPESPHLCLRAPGEELMGCCL